MFQEGGQGSSVRHISPSDDRGAGACIGAQCRELPNGTKVRIDVNGGMVEWWNIPPTMRGVEHQGGIHRGQGPAGKKIGK